MMAVEMKSYPSVDGVLLQFNSTKCFAITGFCEIALSKSTRFDPVLLMLESAGLKAWSPGIDPESALFGINCRRRWSLIWCFDDGRHIGPDFLASVQLGLDLVTAEAI